MSDDCISRAEAIRIAEQGQVQGYPWQIAELSKLQSVQPEQKTGHWEYTTHYGKRYRVCSECRVEKEDDRATGWNYCQYCGAKMIEPQESEG